MKSEDDILSIGCGSCRYGEGKYQCYDDEDAVTCFWACNLTKNSDMYDFETSLDNIQGVLERKLVEHGLRGSGPYREYIEDLYGSHPTRSQLSIQQDAGYVWIAEDELAEVEKKCIAETDGGSPEDVELFSDEVTEACLYDIYEHIAERLAEGYEGVEEFEKIDSISRDIDRIDRMSLSEKVQLFDRAIHLQHITGSLLDVDIERLREQFEEEIDAK